MSRPVVYPALDEDGRLVQAGATQVLGYTIANIDATDLIYVQLFDAQALSDVTIGTTAPDAVIAVAAGQTPAGEFTPASGPLFRTGLVAAATSTATGGEAPASDPVVTFYLA